MSCQASHDQCPPISGGKVEEEEKRNYQRTPPEERKGAHRERGETVTPPRITTHFFNPHESGKKRGRDEGEIPAIVKG